LFSTRRRKPLRRTHALIEHFERATGDRLSVHVTSADLTARGLDRGDLVDAPSLSQKYGTFSILVFGDAKEAAEEARELDRDNQGIFWSLDIAERGSDAGIPKASASKFYGEDLRLSWFRDDALTRTDERWERLDRVLTDFTA
jgi:hypothetical protein